MAGKRLVKRLIDIGACLFLLPVAIPLCLIAMIAIRLESAGSALFVQQRVGRHRKQFRLFKLRTMHVATGDKPSHEVNAAQITKVGAVLRRTKLDELPQLFNVLNGSMSLVGPRPCLPGQRALIEAREQEGLYAYSPGITGPAQVMGIDMSDPVRLAQVEAAYYDHASPCSDLLLVLRTALGSGRGDAVIR